METPEGFAPEEQDPAQEIIRAYQARLRRTRNVLLAETLVLVPLVVILGAILVFGRMQRGHAVVVRFGTVLDVAVADDATAQRVLTSLRSGAAQGKVAEAAVEIEPAPTTVKVTAKEAGEILTEGEALQRIKACAAVKVSMRVAVLKVDGAPLVAAPSEEDVQFALDELKARYANAEGIVGVPKLVTKYAIDSERRPPDSVKFSRDALVAAFEDTKTPDVVEFLGPKLSFEQVLKKHGLTKDQIALRNPTVDFANLGDGTKLLCKPGRDNIEVEYQVARTEVRDIPPPVKETPDPNLEKGKTEVVSPGRSGVASVTIRVTFRNDREVAWETAASQTQVEPEEKVVRVGTKGASTESEAKAAAAKAAPAKATPKAKRP